MTDSEIIEKINSGNTQAFKELIEKYQGVVFRTAMGFVHSKADADDLTQEVFIRVFESLHSFKGKAEFSTWLYRITANCSINFIKRNSKNRLLLSLENIFDHYSNEKTPLEQLEAAERDRLIKAAIDRLPTSQRTAFVLSRYEELPQKEVARIMNKSEGAVEQLLQRAKGNLQKKLDKTVGK